jgi:hypothetical protein
MGNPGSGASWGLLDSGGMIGSFNASPGKDTFPEQYPGEEITDGIEVIGFIRSESL